MIEWGRTSEGTTPIVRDGSVIATLSPAAQRDDAQVEVDGTRWLFYAAREALWAERSGAEKPALQAVRLGRKSWRVTTAGPTYALERAGGRHRFVVRRDDTEIGVASGRSRLKAATLDVSVDTPLAHEVFLLWLIGSKHRGGKSLRPGGSNLGPSPGQIVFDAGYTGGGL